MRSAWVIMGALGCAACVTSAPVREVVPRARAVQVSEAGVWAARAAAVAASEGEEAYTLRLRHNPGRCGAPAFEVWAYGRWERVWLEASTDELAGALEVWAEGAPVGEEREEPVRFAGEERVDARGAVWSVLRVLEAPEADGGEVAGVVVRARRVRCL